MNGRSSAWASPPGHTIDDLLDARGESTRKLADRLGCSLEHVEALIRGEASIDAGLAEALARALGSTAEFWLVREARWRAMGVGRAAPATAPRVL